MRPRLREQAEAQRLRREGKSLREIARAVHASVGSVSVWVRDVPRGGNEAVPEREDKPPSAQPIEPKRRCGRCRKVLRESAFNRHPKGLQWWCRECFREYFRERGALHRAQSAESKRKRQAVAKPFVRNHLRTHPCVDCGESDPIVLEFDHIGTKRADVPLLAAGGASLQLLRDEIEQCEVVCVNCHRRRTAIRGNWRRAAKRWWNTPPPGDHLQSRNIAFAYSYLERNPCVDCGCKELCVLDFDHVGSKMGNVLTLARNGVSLDRLRDEVSRCEVRCANCHRRRTTERRAA